jgi:hypothetical protein
MGNGLYKIGLNTAFKGKPGKSASINYATNWVPSEVTQPELIAHVQQGYAISAHFKNNYRKTANFICSDVVAADIDDRMTLDEALALPFVQQNASFIYTTPSHTEAEHRFRIVFLLEETITKAEDWANCLLGLAIKLDGDRAIKDAGRIISGNPNAKIINLGKFLPQSEAAQLILVGQDARGRPNDKSLTYVAITSSMRIAPNQMVEMGNGRLFPFDMVEPGTSLCCPFHADKHPSAHVVRSHRGSTGIHCMSCNTTFWTEDEPEYDFATFDQLVEQRLAADRFGAAKSLDDPNILKRYFPAEPQVTIHQTQFLPSLDYRPGVSLVKSPKGSGKTEALAAMIDQIRSGKFQQNLAKADHPKSVLLIGHRQMLIQEAAARLGLDCYLDDKSKGNHRHNRFGYAICLDSLHKIALGTYSGGKAGPPSRYDVIILDECEQIFSHLMSETLRAGIGMNQAFASLDFMIRRAKAVYALDADLGMITSQAMQSLRKPDWDQACRIIYNKPLDVSQRRKMSIYKSRNDLKNRMIEAIRAGRRCFITSNSRNTIDKLEELIRKEFGPDLSMLAITSANSRGKDETDFIKNIQTEFLGKQVLLCSPSLGTGIDISFPDGKCEVDEVIGFFSQYVNKHTDIDQQLARVRNPGAVSVWFGGGEQAYETSFDVIRRHLAMSSYVPSAMRDKLDDNGNQMFDEDDPLLNIATHVMVAQRSSRRRLVALFEELRHSQGWDVEHIEKSAPQKKDTSWRDAKETLEERRIEGILTARPLTDGAYAELMVKRRSGGKLSKEDQHSEERYSLERAYKRSVDRTLIEMDRKGKLRRQLNEFQTVFRNKQVSKAYIRSMAAEAIAGRALKKSPVWALVAVVMEVVGLVHDGELVLDRRLRGDDLVSFNTICDANRVIIEEILQSPVRRDLWTNPVRQLNVILGKIGLKLVPMNKTRSGGKVSVVYVLDKDKVALMSEFSRSGQMTKGVPVELVDL